MKTNVKFFIIVFLCIGKFVAADDVPIYEYYVNEITRAFVKEAKKEFGLLCYGSGGSMPHDVVEIELDFECYRHVTIDEARELEVKVTEMLRQRINEHEKIRPYLRDYPCKSRTAHVMISFRKARGGRQTEGVALIFPARNKLFYNAVDPVTNKLCDLFEEPYEEALKIVHSQKKLFRKAFVGSLFIDG